MIPFRTPVVVVQSLLMPGSRRGTLVIGSNIWNVTLPFVLKRLIVQPADKIITNTFDNMVII